MSGSAEALDRFERQTAWLMMVLSLAIIPLLVIPWVADLSPATETAFFTADWIIWGLFAVEYGVRLYLAPSKRAFVRANVVDLVVVALPLLRPLRVVRSARLLRLLRASRVVVFLMRGLGAARVVLTRHGLGYTLLTVGVLTCGAGVLVWAVEQESPDKNIETVGDGLWWAITTLTTVGYGDRFPTSPIGRGVGVALMLIGVGVFGLLAASLASFLLERGREVDTPTDDVGLRDIAARLDRIESELQVLSQERQRDTEPTS
ncbi:MAG TPA: ion transporter [Actinomycetota bacterium]|jgi:voltage-gated potassium channel|nr:ion transporter [Actinomycetota bacterium]